MKTVYFIRHGQSQGNASLIVQQNASTPLTSRGIAQAKKLGGHMKELGIEAVVSSTYVRARMTAEQVAEASGLHVEPSELFVERRRPRTQLERRKVHPSWLWVQLHLILFGHRSGYRHSDEETAEDLIARAQKALDSISERPEDCLTAVTHKTFMRALYAAMTFGETLTGRIYLRATRGMDMRNTSLMVARSDGGIWSVTAWNAAAADLQRLGEEADAGPIG